MYKTKAHHNQRPTRHRLEQCLKEHLFHSSLLSVPSDRKREPTGEGVTTTVLRLRGCHARDDTLGTS